MADASRTENEAANTMSVTKLSDKEQWKATWIAEWLADWQGDSRLSEDEQKQLEQAAEKAYKRHLLSETEQGQEKINNIIFADFVILKAALPEVTAELNTWNNAEGLRITYYPGIECAAWKGDGFVLTARERSQAHKATGISVEWVGECTSDARMSWDVLLRRLRNTFGKYTPEEIGQMFPGDYDRIARKTLSLLHPSYVMTKAEESEWKAKKKAEKKRRVSMTADEIVAEFLGGASAQPTGGEQAVAEFLGKEQTVLELLKGQEQVVTVAPGAEQNELLINPEKKRKILFEGTFPTTPQILFDILHDFRLERASSLEGTAISGFQFNFAPFNEHFSRIYIQLGPAYLETIANIDIRRLNDGLIKITIPSTEGDVTFFRGELWDEISSMTDQFLFDFAIHLEKLYSGNTETKDAQEPTANANRWEKMGEKTQERFSRAWKIYRKMCKDYEEDVLDSASQKPKPTVQDFQVRVLKELHWKVGERRLRTVISYGEDGIIK